ncbi:unnamed protein product [Orchesella dallaii]|uniref:Transmembrane protein n=1 Tax=Orchesella dallaii TaxID=48710 RepID=A0ABP1RVU5_9HEXA
MVPKSSIENPRRHARFVGYIISITCALTVATSLLALISMLVVSVAKDEGSSEGVAIATKHFDSNGNANGTAFRGQEMQGNKTSILRSLLGFTWFSVSVSIPQFIGLKYLQKATSYEGMILLTKSIKWVGCHLNVQAVYLVAETILLVINEISANAIEDAVSAQFFYFQWHILLAIILACRITGWIIVDLFRKQLVATYNHLSRRDFEDLDN